MKNQKLEMEIVGLKKKFEKSNNHVKLNNSLVMLDKLLDCRRSLFDKFGLGLKKVEDKLKEDMWSPKTLEFRSTSFPGESKALHAPTRDNKEAER